MSANTAPRAKALHKLKVEIGQAAVPAFLRARQPSFGDQTGSEILEREPEELIRRLEMLAEQRELETIIEEGGPDDD